MGTRHLTYIYNEDNDKKPFVCMYGQFDGYIEGYGLDLAKFIRPIELVNGISDRDKPIANGMGCLAAQLISHFKTEPGGYYLYAPELDKDVWQEYEYHIWPTQIKVYYKHSEVHPNPIFTGEWREFYDFCNEPYLLSEDDAE